MRQSRNPRPPSISWSRFLGLVLGLGGLPTWAASSAPHDSAASVGSLAACSLPFAALLLCIALLPLIPATAHWWEHNRSKLIVSGSLALLVCGYYLFRHVGFHSEPGLPAVGTLLSHSVLG